MAFSYAGLLLAPHYVANVLFAGASFAIQSFAAAVVARALYRRTARQALLPFARTLVPHEVLFVGLTALALVGGSLRPVGGLLVLGCLLWQVVLTFRFFRALGGADASRSRTLGAMFMHYATIAVLVGGYAHAQDLLPYPPGVP